MTHHYYPDKHHLITVTTSNGNYCVKEISLNLTNEQRQYFLVCHSFTGCDTVSSVYEFRKQALFKRFCSKDGSALIDIFYDDKTTKEHIVNAGIEMVQLLYKSQGILLLTEQVIRYNKRSKTRVLQPESLPLTDGAAAQHSLRAYLQLQGWLVLKSMSRDPKQYNWYLASVGAYELVQALDALAPKTMLL